jgi:NhaP-type Na+/H+ or K+/H+ antiporter
VLLQVVYAVAVFTIVVQGLTMPRLLRRLFGDELRSAHATDDRARDPSAAN